MSHRIPRTNVDNAEQSSDTISAPVLSLFLWNPFLAGILRGNARAHESVDAIANKCQDFVSRRLKEDFTLVQRVAHSSTPAEILAAHAEFWQKAAEDYGREMNTMSKLMSDASSKMAQATQQLAKE